MKFIVTGGAGFVGSNIAFTLEKMGHEVLIIDDFSSGDYRNLIGFPGEVLAIDITDRSAMEYIVGTDIDGIFHEAAITDTTVMDQKRMMQVNTDAYRFLLDWAVSDNVRVVYASSAGVYGNSAAPNCIDHGLLPENVYGFSKYSMDMTTKRYLNDFPDLGVVGLRYFNVYGPGESFKGHAASMVYQLYHQIKAGKTPRLFKHGEQKRDFIFIEDIVQANMKAMFGEEVQSGVYNVGTGKARTFNDMIAIIQRCLGTSIEVEYFDNPYRFYQNHTEADISETTKQLGYNPEFTFEAGIAKYIEYLEATGR